MYPSARKTPSFRVGRCQLTCNFEDRKRFMVNYIRIPANVVPDDEIGQIIEFLGSCVKDGVSGEKTPDKETLGRWYRRLTELKEELDEVMWRHGPYDQDENGCPKCGRLRLCVCPNGKHRCEKCNWSPELNDFVPVSC